MILAGTPTAVAFGGTSVKTTAPAPIFAPSPILTLPSTRGNKTVSAYVGVALALLLARPAERRALINDGARTDCGGFAYDYARAVVDKHARFYLCRGVYLYAREKFRKLGHRTRKKF